MKTQQSENFQVFIRLRPLNQKQKHQMSSLEQAYTKRNALSNINNSTNNNVINSSVQKPLKLSPNAYSFLTKFHSYDLNKLIKLEQSEDTLYVVDPQYKSIDKKMKGYRYNGIFGQKTKNIEIFKTAVQKHIDNVLQGYNATIFTYGITGSGKTHTIFGNNCYNSEDKGICYSIFEYLFRRKQQIQKQSNLKIQFKFSFFQIYNQNLKDLLSTQSSTVSTKGLTIVQDALRGTTTIPQLIQKPVINLSQISQLVKQGYNKRALAATHSNLYSSRSHAILQLIIQFYDDQYNRGNTKLFIIDLAGSQKIIQGGNNAKGVIQGSNINKSLLALGNCINVLANTQKKGMSNHVPYRDSKLTRILKDSLGGNANTLMIACISANPFTIQETITTLNYASRANGIQKKILKMFKQQKIKQQILNQGIIQIPLLKPQLQQQLREQTQKQIPLSIKKQLQGIKFNLQKPFLCSNCGHYQQNIIPFFDKEILTDDVDKNFTSNKFQISQQSQKIIMTPSNKKLNQNVENCRIAIQNHKKKTLKKRQNQFFEIIYNNILENAYQKQQIFRELQVSKQYEKQIKEKLIEAQVKNQKMRIQLKQMLKIYIQNTILIDNAITYRQNQNILQFKSKGRNAQCDQFDRPPLPFKRRIQLYPNQPKGNCQNNDNDNKSNNNNSVLQMQQSSSQSNLRTIKQSIQQYNKENQNPFMRHPSNKKQNPYTFPQIQKNEKKQMMQKLKKQSQQLDIKVGVFENSDKKSIGKRKISNKIQRMRSHEKTLSTPNPFK